MKKNLKGSTTIERMNKGVDDEITFQIDRLEPSSGNEASGGEKFHQDRHGDEHLNVRIVQTDLNEHGASSIVDPTEAVQGGKILTETGQRAPKFVHVATARIFAVFADVQIRVQFVTRSIAKSSIDRRTSIDGKTLIRVRIDPSGQIRSPIFVRSTVIAFAPFTFVADGQFLLAQI